MKITKLRVKYLDPRFSVLLVYTDEGIVGVGEACLEGKPRVVEQAIADFEHYLVGADPLQTERIWTELHRGVFYPIGSVLASAISAVDQALWDIKGKHFDVPVHQLLGGPLRDRVRLYEHVNVGDWVAGELERGDEHIADLVERAKRAVADGFTMIKTALPGPARPVESKAFIDFQGRRFEALRKAVGDNVDIGIDFHGRVRPATAASLIHVLEEFSPYFVEEPCLPENVDEMAVLARKTHIPIATGERLFTRWGFRDVLAKGAASVLQPDLAHCGGISEGFKIAAMGDVHYAVMAPHNPLGPVNLAASVQLALAIPNFSVQEQIHLGTGILVEPFTVQDGYLLPPTGPGLGVEIDQEALEAASYAGDWHLPTWRHPEDNSNQPW